MQLKVGYNPTMKRAVKIALITVLAMVLLNAFFWGATLVRFYYFRPVVIRGESMEPALAADSVRFMNTTKQPAIGDICVFYMPGNEGEQIDKGNEFLRSMPILGTLIKSEKEVVLIVKRVVGVGGDTIQFVKEEIDGVEFIYLYRNGEKVEEDIIMLDRNSKNEATRDYFYAHDGNVEFVNETEPYVVPDNCYYLLGDNRDMSSDSRNYGAVSGDTYVGTIR